MTTVSRYRRVHVPRRHKLDHPGCLGAPRGCLLCSGECGGYSRVAAVACSWYTYEDTMSPACSRSFAESPDSTYILVASLFSRSIRHKTHKSIAVNVIPKNRVCHPFCVVSCSKIPRVQYGSAGHDEMPQGLILEEFLLHETKLQNPKVRASSSDESKVSQKRKHG